MIKLFFLDTIKISTKITSAYLFLKAANMLLSKGKGFPRHGKPNNECTVVPLTLMLASPVDARISTGLILVELPWYCNNLVTDKQIVFIKCDFRTPPEPDMNILNGFTALGLIELFCFTFSFANVKT